jgi:hypothetical protein
MAKQKAEALLRDEGIAALPVDPYVIAASRDIAVRPKPDTAEGVSGMLLRHGDAFGILYATHVPSEGFQRFSVSHELGHYFLDGHIDHVLPRDGTHTSCAGFLSADPYELEADHFAAGLLMPAVAFRSAIRSHPPGLAAVEALACLCRTSLPATAIRYTELAEDAIAIVVSTGATIDYCFLSETIKSLPQLSWLRRGMPVPADSATARFSASPDRVAAAERSEAEIDIMDWLGGVRSAQAIEEVIGLSRYGRTLTVLTCPSIRDETYGEDEALEEDLIQRWTPRFR